jgi:hypothetical protein
MSLNINEMIQKKRDEAAKATEELRKYELMQEILNDSEMRKVLEEQLGVRSAATPTPSTGGVGLSKLKKAMSNNGNEPMLIVELAEAAGLSVSSVRQLMTKTQAFVKVSTNENRQGLYQLKDSVNNQSGQG